MNDESVNATAQLTASPASRAVSPETRGAHAEGRLAMGRMADLLGEGGLTIPPRDGARVVLLPEPPTRTPRTVPATAASPSAPAAGRPRWEPAEHTFIGDAVTLQFEDGSVKAGNCPLHLQNGQALTYGQIIALGGDFYGLVGKPISDDPQPPERFLQAFGSLAESPSAPPEVQAILAVMQEEIDLVNAAIARGEDPSTVYAELGDRLSGLYNKATGGGSGLSELLPPGRYLELAMTNWDHFGKHAITAYTIGHAAAVKKAILASKAPAGERRALLEAAYAMNAFADHFLTDLFAAGHMRTPRKQMHDAVSPSALGDYLCRYMHNEDGCWGLTVRNANGDLWKAYGDQKFFDRVNARNAQIVLRAVQASADEVHQAYHTGSAAEGARALTYVADLEAVQSTQGRENPAAMFISDGSSVLRRNDLADRFDYSWTHDWSTYATFAKIKYYDVDDCGNAGEIPFTLDVNLLQLWDNHGSLAMVEYAPQPSGFYDRAWSQDDMGEGAGAVAWLSGDLKGDGATNVLQLWNHGGKLGLNVYSPKPGGVGYFESWRSEDMGEGPGAVQWLAFDANEDGRTEIVQLWDNHGRLGIVVYAPSSDGVGYRAVWKNDDMGEGSGAVQWLVVRRGGKRHIVQLWDNHGQLGMVVYSPSGVGFVEAWRSDDMGQGSGAVAWAVVASGADEEIAQMWANGGSLGMITYGPIAGQPGYQVSWGGMLPEGPSAEAWLVVDMNGDGQQQLVQLWSNHGQLGMVVYARNDSGIGFHVAWRSEDMGEGAGAVQWLTCTTDGDGSTSLVQLWDNDGQLGIIVYSPDGKGGYQVAGHKNAMGEGPGALAWFTANVVL